VRLSFSDRVEVPRYVLVHFLEKETVLLSMKAEVYYGLDETATRMWQVLTSASSIENAYEQLRDEFEVEPELLRQNLSELLGQLVDEDLLRIHPPDVESAPKI
jgi:antirestriction protein